MKPFAALALIALLAACGADGEPVKPSVSTGISINNHGHVHGSTSVTASRGNVSVTIGAGL